MSHTYLAHHELESKFIMITFTTVITCTDKDHISVQGFLVALLCLQIQCHLITLDLCPIHFGVQLELEPLLGQRPLKGFPYFAVLHVAQDKSAKNLAVQTDPQTGSMLACVMMPTHVTSHESNGALLSNAWNI